MLRERRIKEWKRAWKVQLIEKENPHWIDLYPMIAGDARVPAFAGTAV